MSAKDVHVSPPLDVNQMIVDANQLTAEMSARRRRSTERWSSFPPTAVDVLAILCPSGPPDSHAHEITPPGWYPKSAHTPLTFVVTLVSISSPYFLYPNINSSSWVNHQRLCRSPTRKTAVRRLSLSNRVGRR